MKSLDPLKNEVCEIMDNDPAHDFGHVMRVYKNAQKLCRQEKADERLVLGAALLHDVVSYPKSDSRSEMSSVESAKKSVPILRRHGFSDGEIIIIQDAISDHAFSRNKIPETPEGRILQDADRLDALGAIGIARVFATAGSLGRPFYSADDPFCKVRSPDDKTWTVDHFFQKLLKLESMMNTKSGRAEAKKRTVILTEFLKTLKCEI